MKVVSLDLLVTYHLVHFISIVCSSFADTWLILITYYTFDLSSSGASYVTASGIHILRIDLLGYLKTSPMEIRTLYDVGKSISVPIEQFPEVAHDRLL